MFNEDWNEEFIEQAILALCTSNSDGLENLVQCARVSARKLADSLLYSGNEEKDGS